MRGSIQLYGRGDRQRSPGKRRADLHALDAGRTLPGFEHDHTRASWLGIDGTVSWIERKGPAFVVVLGAPLWLAFLLMGESVLFGITFLLFAVGIIGDCCTFR